MSVLNDLRESTFGGDDWNKATKSLTGFIDRPIIIRLLAADCAERVLHIFEAGHKGDSRPRNTIAAARNNGPESKPVNLEFIFDSAWVSYIHGRRDEAAKMVASYYAGMSAAVINTTPWDSLYYSIAAILGDSEAGVAARWRAIESRLHQYLEHGDSAKDMEWV